VGVFVWVCVWRKEVCLEADWASHWCLQVMPKDGEVALRLKHKEDQENKKLVAKYGVFYDHFKPKFWWWEVQVGVCVCVCVCVCVRVCLCEICANTHTTVCRSLCGVS
jgi:hypothetical protein